MPLLKRIAEAVLYNARLRGLAIARAPVPWDGASSLDLCLRQTETGGGLDPKRATRPARQSQPEIGKPYCQNRAYEQWKGEGTRKHEKLEGTSGCDDSRTRDTADESMGRRDRKAEAGRKKDSDRRGNRD